MKVLEATFKAAAPNSRALPPPVLPEAAFVGRSNVGKSSLIAALTGRKKLVRVSRQPGCTQSINFFEVRLEPGPLTLVDLPGYGYATAPTAEQERWGPLILSYLRDRTSLCLIVVLLDPRRTLRDDDHGLFELLAAYRRPTVVVATKMDKIPKAKQKLALSDLEQAVGVPVLPASAKTGAGVDLLWETVARACGLIG